MSKVIISPVERWAGTVTLHDPLTLPQLAAFHKATLVDVAALGDPRKVSMIMLYNAVMPGLYACIQSFDLKNWPAPTFDLFPTKPRSDAVKMMEWLLAEVNKLAQEGDEEVPKSSTPEPTSPQSEREVAKS